MRAAQIPDSQEQISTQKNIFTISWYTFMQSLYKACRLNLPTRLTGILTRDSTIATNTGAGTTDLISYTLPAKMMRNNGDYLEIEGWGTFATNANNKTVTLNFGSHVIYATNANPANGGTWYLKGKISRKLVASQEIMGKMLSNNPTVQDDPQYPVSETSATEDLDSEVVIKFTATGVATGDIVQRNFIISLTPND